MFRVAVVFLCDSNVLRLCPMKGSYKKLQLFCKDFSRATLGLQGPPTRNIISQNVHKYTFPVCSSKALRRELFASPNSLQFSVHFV